jgi:16S rRNA (guanine527-N7)-methyltransferase
MTNKYTEGLSPSAVLSALQPFGVVPAAQQVDTIRDYIRLLVLWNEQVGLTALSEPEEVLTRHFGESLFAARHVPFGHSRLADIGTGGGFPGLAIRIFRPDIQLLLVESNKKKAAFLAEAVRTLGVNNVDIVASRFEDWRPGASSLDFITSRALGRYSFLMRWAVETLKPTGKLILWLGDDEGNRVQMRPGWHWDPPERIPLSRRRQILVGSPTRTPII